MRSVFAIVAVLVLVVVACEGTPMMQNPFHDQRLIRARAVAAIKEMHQNVKTRKFVAQQAATQDPVCSTDAGITFVTEALTKCAAGATTGGSTTTPATMADANTAMEPTCLSDCMTYLQAADTKLLGCAPSQFKPLLDYAMFTCTKINDNYCGAVFMMFGDMECDNKYSQSSCAAKSECTWNAQRSKCDMAITSTQLDSLCSPCLDLFLNSFSDGGVSGPAARAGVEIMKQTLCTKVEGQYCFPMLIDMVNGNQDPFDMEPAALDGFCGQSAKLLCMRKVVSGTFASSKGLMDDAYRHCVHSYGNDTYATQRYCQPSYAVYKNSMRTVESSLSQMCVKNANGMYCFAKDNTSYPCVDALFSTMQCNATCDPEVKAAADKLGCCLGMLQQMMGGAGQLPQSEYPHVVTTGTMPPTVPRPTANPNMFSVAPHSDLPLGENEARIENPGTGNLEMLGVCPSLNADIKGRLAIKCVMPTVAAVKKAIKLKVKYSKIAADPALKTRLIGALKADTAGALGVTQAEILNADLIEDTTVTVARRQTTTNSGSKFIFELNTGNAAVNSAASAEFDKMASEQSLILPATTSVVTNEYTDCVVAGTASLVDSVESPASGASSVVASMAAVLVALLMLVA